MSLIYALIDPRTEKIRYIGKTDDDVIGYRYAGHLATSNHKLFKHRKISIWIRELMNQGLFPFPKILFNVQKEFSNHIEDDVIKHYQSFCSLINEVGMNKNINGRGRSKRKKYVNEKKIPISGIYKPKAVCQYSRTGIFIKEWKSGREIERELGFYSSGISRCCRGIKKGMHGFIWRFKNV